jgi:hypothetical protein
VAGPIAEIEACRRAGEAWGAAIAVHARATAAQDWGLGGAAAGALAGGVRPLDGAGGARHREERPRGGAAMIGWPNAGDGLQPCAVCGAYIPLDADLVVTQQVDAATTVGAMVCSRACAARWRPVP